jgi:GDPmannose 4,6-dehydratase
MTKLALITGITGQDGSYLSEFLLEKKYKIYGIVRRNSLLYTFNRLENIKKHLNLFYGDLTDGSSLFYIINTIINNNPEFEILEIYNLAAQSHVKISFDNPEYTSQVDGLGTLKILETIRSLSSNNFNKIKFYQASTSELFGDVLEIPQNEKTPFNPQSPYACAKLYSHYLVKNYREGYKLFACSGILFNHESPRRCDNFVTKKIINHVKEIKKLLINNEYDHRIKPLQLGNLNSKRDWGHAKDYVRAMWLMLQQEQAEDYVISMGETNSVREFIIKSFAKIEIEIDWRGEGINERGYDKNKNILLITINEKYFRPCEVNLLIGDSSRAKNELGWKPEIDTLDKLIDNMLFN